jgi:hypothetical protein
VRTPLKLAAFAAVLVAALGVAMVLGRLSGVDGEAAADAPTHDAHETGEVDADLPAGLQVAADGYVLEVLSHPTEPGREQPLKFRISGPGGAAVTEFTESHEADLHLIVVRRDLADYQHLHPELAPDGIWSVAVSFAGAGTYRAFADFVPAGRDDGLTLGVDLPVAGEYLPEPTSAPNRTSEVDGYTVTLDGDLVAGTVSPVTLSVSRDGEPVADLQPYLGADGHLVALRAGDLAYLHVHPEGEHEPGGGHGPEVGFAVEAPSAGTYRLFFEFRHEGAVRTVEYTVETAHDH